MAVVLGDRIGESRRLNARPADVQNFYTAFVAVYPDDFLRFRLSVAHVAVAMYPRREHTPALLRMVKRCLDWLGRDLGDGIGPMWRTWEVDGVTFGELVTGTPRGNRYHRTPEPPGSTHVHSESCLPTAIARAREWADSEHANMLSMMLKRLRRERELRGGGEGGLSVPSVPSVPVQNGLQKPAAGAASEPPPTPATPEEATAYAKAKLGEPPKEPPRRAAAREVLGYWREKTGRKSQTEAAERKALARVEARLKEGSTTDELRRCVDVAMTDPFYRQKNYHKLPEVIWRDAERVQSLLSKAESPPARDAPRVWIGPVPDPESERLATAHYAALQAQIPHLAEEFLEWLQEHPCGRNDVSKRYAQWAKSGLPEGYPVGLRVDVLKRAVKVAETRAG